MIIDASNKSPNQGPAIAGRITVIDQMAVIDPISDLQNFHQIDHLRRFSSRSPRITDHLIGEPIANQVEFLIC